MACFHGGILQQHIKKSRYNINTITLYMHMFYDTMFRVYPKINSIILAVTNTNEKDYKSLLYSTEKRTKMPDSV